MAELENLYIRNYEGVGEYEVPIIFPEYELPKVDKWLEFEWAKNKRNKPLNTGVHFFQYDHKIECVWTFPERYLEALKSYSVVLSPDFSMYTKMPKAIQIYNHYRAQWVGAYWQERGMFVIPTVQWSTEDSYDWCFDGLPMYSIVAVSNVGCMQDNESKRLFHAGYEAMLDIVKPSKILFYSNSYPEGLDGNIHFIKYNIDKSIGR